MLRRNKIFYTVIYISLVHCTVENIQDYNAFSWRKKGSVPLLNQRVVQTSRFRCRYNLDLAQVVYPPRSDAAEEKSHLASLFLAWSTTSVCILEHTVVSPSKTDNRKSSLSLSLLSLSLSLSLCI